MGDRPLVELDGRVWSAVAVATSVRDHASAIAAATVPGDRIAIRADTDAATLFLLAAVTAAGRVAVPLDPREPPERLDQLLLAADPALRLRTTGAGDDRWTRWAPPANGDDPPPRPDPPAAPDDPALLLFTSGTTGRPKGIVRTHGMLVRQGVAQGALWSGVPAKRLGSVYPLSFLGAFLNLLACLESQATYCGLDPSSLGPAALATAIRDRRITLFLAVPSLLRSVCEHAQRHAIDLSGVELVAFGGEPITAADVGLMRSVMPNAPLLNCYGTQEAGTAAIEVLGDIDDGTLVPAGRPTPDSVILVVDGAVQCPPGVVGEVLLGGPNVCTEYWRDPEATAAARVEIDGVPAMRTGDLGRWHDGVLEVVGRTDHRVKVRGQGVDLSAVDAALLAHDAIAAAAVTSVPDARSGNRLVAHVQPTPGIALDPVEVRRTLHDRLPGYMVPGTILLTDALPLTPRGKVDRAALHAAALAAPRPRRGRDPRTDVEARVRDLMGEVLAVPGDDLGCDDDFAALGGDSLRALELVEAIDATFGLDPDTRLAVEECFTGPTTVEVIAHVLAGGTDTQRGITRDGAALVPVRIASDQTRVQCVVLMGAGYPPLTLRALADRLDGAALTTFLPRGMLDRRWPDRTIAALAQRNVDLLREQPPSAPVVLVGHSFGAIVAFDMARRLRAAGDDVALLVIVDARVHPGRGPRTVRGRVRHAARVARTHLLGWVAALTVVSAPSAKRRQRALMDVCGPMYLHHAPSTYDGDVLVVRAAANHGSPADLGWSAVVGGALRVVEIPGTHASVMRAPDVDGLAGVLNDEIGRIAPTATPDG